jgi:acetylornithine deacetylase
MPNSREQEVLQVIDERREQVIETLQTLLRFPTVTPGLNTRAEGDAYIRFQQYMQKRLESLDFEIDTWEIDASRLETFWGSGVDPDRDLSNMPVVVGTRKGRGEGRSLLLNGHYDVVPPGELSNWTYRPFEGRVVENRIYGRGSSDMKGGITAVLEALQCIELAGISLNGDVLVQSVPDEEGSTMGTLACCQRGYRAQAAIVPEPTGMNVQLALRGGASGKITVYGRAGHADQTQPHWRDGGAVNAITKSVKIIQALEELTKEWRSRPDKKHKFLDPDIVIPTLINGGEWFVMYPERVEIDFTSDFIPGTTDLWQELEDKIKKAAATDPWMRAHPPQLEPTDTLLYGAEVEEDEPIVQTTLAAARDLGLDPHPIGSGGLTDAVHLINYAKVATVSIGPSGKSAHMVNEFINIDELIQLTKVLALAILRWCGHTG